METRRLHLTHTDIVDLIGACQARLTILDQLRAKTSDMEDRERIFLMRERIKRMLNRLVQL